MDALADCISRKKTQLHAKRPIEQTVEDWSDSGGANAADPYLNVQRQPPHKRRHVDVQSGPEIPVPQSPEHAPSGPPAPPPTGPDSPDGMRVQFDSDEEGLFQEYGTGMSSSMEGNDFFNLRVGVGPTSLSINVPNQAGNSGFNLGRNIEYEGFAHDMFGGWHNW